MIPGIIRLVSATLVTIGKARVFGYGWECGKGMHSLTMARIEGGIEGHEIFSKSFVSVCCHSTNMLSKHGYLFLSLARPTSLRRPSPHPLSQCLVFLMHRWFRNGGLVH